MSSSRSRTSFSYHSFDGWLKISYENFDYNLIASLDALYSTPSVVEAKEADKSVIFHSLVFKYTDGIFPQTCLAINSKNLNEIEIRIEHRSARFKITAHQTAISNLIREIAKLELVCPGSEDRAKNLLEDIDTLVHNEILNAHVTSRSKLISKIADRLAKDSNPFRKEHVSEKLKTKTTQYLEDQCARSNAKTLPADEKKITYFHSQKDPREFNPEATITWYFNRLSTYLPLPDEAYIAALFLMSLFRKEVSFNYFTIHRLLLSAWYVAAKHFNITFSDEYWTCTAGTAKEEIERMTTELKNNSLVKACNLDRNEHFAMLAFLLDGEINHGIKLVLMKYLFADVCSIVSSYLTPAKPVAPSNDLKVYVSYLHLFPPQFSRDDFTCDSDNSPTEIRRLEKS